MLGVAGFTLAVFAAAALIHVLGVRQLQPLPSAIALPWWLLVAAFAVVEMAVIHLHLRRTTQTFSLSELPLVVGLFFAAPEALVLARLAGGAAGLYLHRRQHSMKVAFNVATMWVEAGTAVILFHWMLNGAGGETSLARFAAFGAALAAGTVGTILVGAVTAIHDRGLKGSAWRRLLVTGLVTFAANASLGLVAVTLLQVDATSLVFLLVVGVIVFSAYSGYSKVHRRHEDLEVLYDFTQAVGSAVHVESVGVRLLARARDLLRADHAELILERDGSATARLVLVADDRLEPADDSPLTRELRERLTVVDSLVVPRATKDEVQRAFLDQTRFNDAVLVRLSADSDVHGTVVIANRVGGVTTFTPQDLRLLQTLANHAGVALANSRLVDRLTHQATAREHEALHDALTGLPNRTLFQRELASVIEPPTAKAAVLLMDLDGFKEVNDTLGHHAGDLLLRDVAGRLERALEGTGVVARLGGDEFAVLLPGVGGELAAKTVAHEVLTVLRQQTTVEGVRVDIGASIGIALCPAHGREAHGLLRRADIAMYAAKDMHSPIQIYSAERDFHSPQRLALVGELRSTLEHGELRVVYQPKADLRTGRVVGVEALARWHHPERGFVPPDEFVPVAERSGLIQPLTRHVLRTALTQCRAWRLGGDSLSVSVNLSARSLLPDLPADVARVLGETGVAANALTLEITESSIMADPTHTGHVLEELSAMGVSVAIDDFGTGYSSLTYLKRLPVDEIKIDKSFVLGMSRDEDDAAIVRSTVDLGRNLGLRVVAEGIEEAETWSALRTLGCDMAQGYFLSPPLTAAELDAWLPTHREGGAPTITEHKTVRLPPDTVR